MSLADAAPHTADASPSKALSDEQIAFIGVLVFVGVLAAATVLWGLPGLAMTALTMVPVMYTVLILITFGK